MNTATTKFSARTFSAHSAPPSRRRSSQLISLRGELDAAAHETLCHATRTSEHDLLIDLTRVTFLDAAGLGCLLNLRHNRLSRGRTVTMYGASPRVHELFSLVGLDSLLMEPPPPPPDPAATGRHSVVTSVQTRVGLESAGARTRHLLWQSRLFAITAWVRSEPRRVYAIASGDFSSPGTVSVLQRALTRLARFEAPIEIDSRAVTNASTLAFGIFQAHRHARRVDPGAGTLRRADPSVAETPNAPRAA